MNAKLHWYRVEPRDPLMVRDGRPFSVDTDGARSLDFPPPSVLAGMVRTRVGLTEGKGSFTMKPEQARQIGNAADGVVVGSAFVKLIGEHVGRPGLVGTVEDYAASLKAALR